MPWVITAHDVGPTESIDCQHQGCVKFADVHAIAKQVGGTGVRRQVHRALCNVHLEEARAKAQTREAMPPAPSEERRADPAREDRGEGYARAVGGGQVVPRKPLTWPIPEGQPTTCRSCASAVYWIITANNRRMPIEAFGEHRGESHFIHCPNADQHRKARETKPRAS